jgi:hypothetical protein
MSEEFTVDKEKESLLQRVRKCHYFDNLVDVEYIIAEAIRKFKEDKEFINKLNEYREDLKIKNFHNSLGDNAGGFHLFMLKFREKLIEDITGVKKEV